MKTMKTLLYRFMSVLAAAVLLAGCTQLFLNDGGTQSGTDGCTIKLVLVPAGSTQTLSVSTASTTLARSAYPSSLDSSMLYKVTALESGETSSTDCTVSVSDAALSFKLLSGKTWDITVAAYDSTDTSYATPLLTGTTSVTLSANQTTASATVSLGPADGTTGNGTVSLKMTDETTDQSISSITAVVDDSTITLTSADSIWTFSDSLAAGTYNVVFDFYNSDSTLIGFYPDKIAVYPGLTTDKWYVSGSSGSDTLSITDDMMHTTDSNTYFVSGTGGGFTGSDSNSGTVISSPFATLSAALSAVNSANDGTSSYTIYVDGTLTETEQTVDGSAAGYCEQIAPEANLTLTISGLSSAVLDASALSSVNLLQVAGSSSYTVNLTLKDITLKCPSGTSDTEAYGVYTNSYFESGSTLTLDGCTITADSAYTCPVYTVASDGGDLAVTLSDSTAVTASDTTGTALETTGSVTIASSEVSVTGILQAGSIVAEAVPSSDITVEPYASSETSAVTLFSGTTPTSENISSFPLWDTTNYYYTDSFEVMPVQTFSWNGSSSCSATITYAGTSHDVFTTSDAVSSGYFCSAFDSSGQIYVMYYGSNSSSYTLYTAGTAYSVSSGLEQYYHSSLCVLSDGSLLFAPCSGGTALYKLTLSDGSCTDVTLSDSDYPDGPGITSLAAVENNGTQYVFYTYTDSAGEPYIPKLVCAVLSGTTLKEEWAESVSISDVYGSSVSIADMTVGLDGNLYMLLSDTSTANFLLNGSMYLTYRGALICAGSAQSLASGTAPSALSLTSYGWRSSSDLTTACTASGYDSYTIAVFASSSYDYISDQYFAGPVRFLGLTPKQITMADYGIYVDGTSYNSKSGTAVFTLDDSTLDLSTVGSGVYGEYASGSITTYSSSYELMN